VQVIRYPPAHIFTQAMAMLRRRGGATLPDLIEATRWQAQTLRARMNVSARKNRWKLSRDRKAGVTVYRVGAITADFDPICGIGPWAGIISRPLHSLGRGLKGKF
jgi:hypothetical protein